MTTKRKHIISLDVGHKSIKAVEGQVLNDGRIKIFSKASIDLPEGCFENGIINDRQLFTQSLSAVLKKIHGSAKDVVLSFESTEVIKRNLTVPKVSDEDLADLLRYEITEYLPIDINNFVMQHKRIGEVDEGKVEVQLVAVPQTIVTDIYEVIKELGYNPIGMDLHTNGLETLVSRSRRYKEGTVAFVDIGYRYTNIIIFQKGKFVFNRLVSIGVNIFDQAMGSIVDDDDNVVGDPVSVRIGEIWKQYRYGDLSLIQMDDEERLFIDEIVNTMDMLLDEIDKVVKYYNNRETGNHIDDYRLYGYGGLIPGMAEALSTRFEAPVENIQVEEFAEIVPSSENPLFFKAMTAMLPSMNFFHQFIKEKPKSDPRRLIALMIAGLVVALVAYLSIDLLMKKSSLQGEIEVVEQALSDPTKAAAIHRIEEKAALKGTLDQALQVIALSMITQISEDVVSDKLFDVINAQMPEKIFINDISIGSAKVKMNGYAHDYQAIIQFADKLRKCGSFSNVAIGTVENQQSYYSYDIELDVLPRVKPEENKEEVEVSHDR